MFKPHLGTNGIHLKPVLWLRDKKHFEEKILEGAVGKNRLYSYTIL